jgi:tetratricopeptide (TPR) repeat protein
MKLHFASAVAVAVFALAWAHGQPPSKTAEVEKAEALFREGKVDDAFKALQAAATKHAELPPARLMLARLFFSAGQSQQGRAALEQAAAEAPDHPEIYLTNGSQALAEGRLTDTVLNCQTAQQLAAATRWTADQRKTWQREARAGQAMAFETRRDWESARTQLTAWLDLEPKNGSARQRLARAQFMLGRADDAFTELQQAAKDDPALEPAEVMMGRLASQKGDAKLAEEWFEKAAQKQPRDARVHRAFGDWLLNAGRLDAARVHIETAAQLEPKARETLGLQGLLARYGGDYAAAAKLFEAIVQEEPGNFWATNQLALCGVELADRRQRAVQLAEVNARQYPRSPEALATLGWVYYRTGKLDEAERALATSVSGGQASADTAFYLARVQADRGKFAEARNLLKSAVASEGTFVHRADAKKLLDEVMQKAPPEEKKPQ